MFESVIDVCRQLFVVCVAVSVLLKVLSFLIVWVFEFVLLCEFA